MGKRAKENQYYQARLKQEKEDRYRQFLANRVAWLALCTRIRASYQPKDGLKKYLFERSMPYARHLLASTTAYNSMRTSQVIAALDIVEFYANLAGLVLPYEATS